MVATIGKKHIQVQRSSYNGKDLLDVRELYTTKEGTLAPTKKGISIPWSEGHRLVDAINFTLNPTVTGSASLQQPPTVADVYRGSLPTDGQILNVDK
jgi:hypothetical protein